LSGTKFDIDKTSAMIAIRTRAQNISGFINTCEIAIKFLEKLNQPLMLKQLSENTRTLKACKFRKTDACEDIKSILRGVFEHRALE